MHQRKSELSDETRMHLSRMRLLWGGGVTAQGVCLGWDVCLRGGGVSARGVSGSPLPCGLWTEFLTHACENITFLQLRLRTVKTVTVNTESG